MKTTGKLKKILLIVFGLMLFCVVLYPTLNDSLVQFGLKSAPFDQADWRRLKHPGTMAVDLDTSRRLVGMTEEQVVELLGKPDSKSDNVTDPFAKSGAPKYEKSLNYRLNGFLFYEPMEIMLQEGKVAKLVIFFG